MLGQKLGDVILKHDPPAVGAVSRITLAFKNVDHIGDDDDGDVGGVAGGTESMARGAGSAVPGADEAMRELSPGGAAGSTAPRTRGAGSSAPRDEPEAKRRREASNLVTQEITNELRAFGAVVGPKLTRCATQEAEGIEIGQLDLKDAVASEIFCRNRFASNASSFG